MPLPCLYWAAPDPVGDIAIQDASFTLMIPAHDELHIADTLPVGQDQQINGALCDFADYPTVSVRDHVIYVSSTPGEIPACFPVEVFERPLRMCVSSALDGKHLKMQYKLYGSNLRRAIRGKLALSFRHIGDTE